MPIYKFQIDSKASVDGVLNCIKGLIHEPFSLGTQIKQNFGVRRDDVPPFVGRVVGNAFKCRRDIHYRNSFVPRIRGRVAAAGDQTRIDILMYLHPGALLLLVLVLGAVTTIAWKLAQHGAGAARTAVPVCMVLFALALTLGGFFPEAFKARRILEDKIRSLT